MGMRMRKPRDFALFVAWSLVRFYSTFFFFFSSAI